MPAMQPEPAEGAEVFAAKVETVGGSSQVSSKSNKGKYSSRKSNIHFCLVYASDDCATPTKFDGYKSRGIVLLIQNGRKGVITEKSGCTPAFAS
jgi:hypothetical protein